MQSHNNGKSHKEKEQQAKGQSNQQTFFVTGAKQLIMSRGQFVLTTEQQVLKSEIIQSLIVVDSNHSFASATDDGFRFREMFPDSEISTSAIFTDNEETWTTLCYGL